MHLKLNSHIKLDLYKEVYLLGEIISLEPSAIHALKYIFFKVSEYIPSVVTAYKVLLTTPVTVTKQKILLRVKEYQKSFTVLHLPREGGVTFNYID